ncbi:hypothetical protein Bca52824_075543 [Brassica carinata]|uniref:Uncharacterized protein n=1 Tax=Brassica carinata TaxID=52824 RepID=A0A8X7PPT1_BRACI|nr:hypothetical protein Bca52824_075543 [Brassica carinata]
MACLRSPLYMIILFAYGVAISSSFLSRAHEQNNRNEETRSVGLRFLIGPCVSCNSSERRKEKYRCSETDYGIPFNYREVRGDESSTQHKAHVLSKGNGVSHGVNRVYNSVYPYIKQNMYATFTVFVKNVVNFKVYYGNIVFGGLKWKYLTL